MNKLARNVASLNVGVEPAFARFGADLGAPFFHVQADLGALFHQSADQPFAPTLSYEVPDPEPFFPSLDLPEVVACPVLASHVQADLGVSSHEAVVAQARPFLFRKGGVIQLAG